MNTRMAWIAPVSAAALLAVAYLFVSGDRGPAKAADFVSIEKYGFSGDIGRSINSTIPMTTSYLIRLPMILNIPAEYPIERSALIAFYDSTNGDIWRNNSGWKTNLPYCTWYGVTCDANNHVMALHLGNNGLGGSLPPEIGNLEMLTSIFVEGSCYPLGKIIYCFPALTGYIPPEIGKLRNLRELHVTFNDRGYGWAYGLTGSLPPEIGNLINLQDLNLSGNLLSSIPSEIGNLTNLKHLDLSWNNLYGSIPPEIGNLQFLQDISLVGNQLSGSIPVEFKNLLNLQALALSANQLSGDIPLPEIGSMPRLTTIDLSYNKLSGPILPEIGNLSNLVYLSIHHNLLTGPIPPEIIKLNVSELNLSSNQLSGQIPPELGNFSSLYRLSLANNQLSGTIPAELSNLNITELDLSYNPGLLCWETIDARNWALSLYYGYYGPKNVCGSIYIPFICSIF